MSSSLNPVSSQEAPVMLRVEGVSKQYRLGKIGTGTLSHDLNRWWHRIRGKEDPYLKIGETNDRSTKGSSEYVWALKDINFDVCQGEVLGIIGKNGAGKSTLLKILSRVTSPTTGSVKSAGRIASLLEVGTGFHKEMTGRENIYLNGAILGMTKKEIASKLDEIIAFSGCERYIDTPVKRYSSGMTVRLAFAVAAHLDPEILVVDEVLAVGDAEFQNKAIGKMQEISKGGGRTVLFVSHNMASVRTLCNRGVVLDQGRIVFDGNIDESVDFYKNNSVASHSNFDFQKHISQLDTIKLSGFDYYSDSLKKDSGIFIDDSLFLEFEITSKISTTFTLRATFFNSDEVRVMAFDSSDVGQIFNIEAGEVKKICCHIEEPLMVKSGFYKVNISLRRGAILYDHIKEVTSVQILEKDVFGTGRFSYKDMAIVLKKHRWS